MDKQQVLVIHGGTTFDTYEEYFHFLSTCEIDINRLRPSRDWKDSLQQNLGDDFDVLMPKMPNSNNSKYEEWKLWFERVVALLGEDIILMGHSLGGIFLAKYLSENKSSKKIKALFLVSAPYDTEELLESLGSFALTQRVSSIQEQVSKIFLYHSKDDGVVPFPQSAKYKNDLPNSTLRVFNDRGHFKQTEFPELVGDVVRL